MGKRLIHHLNKDIVIKREFAMIQKICSLIIPFVLLCSYQSKNQSQSTIMGGKNMEIKITSAAFDEGGMIPEKYTCDGIDISPPLTWTSVPDGTKTLALICDDPDAPLGTWVHWVLFNIPANINELAEATPHDKELENGAKQGKNGFRKIGYGGPCPPRGTHRYYFKI
ncbi:MAG: YbhB/YbcL family Raf kinase inhibitor-like protein, partial [Candidatus Aminicenantes bacterium]|nr:YbhB/YbcL family Raf kinase inhibitor-like protein [Candidatus Aminicenantes bacterium]